MKILWVSHFVPFPPTSGALQRSHHLLRQTCARHEIHLLALRQRALLPDAQVEEAERALRSLCASVEIRSIPGEVSAIKTALTLGHAALGQTPYHSLRFVGKFFREAMDRLARRVGPHVIHVDTISLLNDLPRVPDAAWVINHHNVESHVLERRAAADRGVRRWYLAREGRKLLQLEKAVCPRSSMNLVVSDLDARRLLERVGSIPFTVVPNGVDTSYFTPTDGADDNRSGLVFVGGFDWHPNRDAVDFFIREIWPKLERRGGNRTFTVIGRSPPQELQRAATRDSSIKVTGFVPDIRPLVRQARIYVCPIREGGGTRLKILDALAMAMPLVATRVAVEGLDLIPDKHFLEASTAADFANAIERLDSDPALRQRLGEAGRQFVASRYDWVAIGAVLDDAYRAAASQPAGNAVSAAET